MLGHLPWDETSDLARHYHPEPLPLRSSSEVVREAASDAVAEPPRGLFEGFPETEMEEADSGFVAETVVDEVQVVEEVDVVGEDSEEVLLNDSESREGIRESASDCNFEDLTAEPQPHMVERQYDEARSEAEQEKHLDPEDNSCSDKMDGTTCKDVNNNLQKEDNAEAEDDGKEDGLLQGDELLKQRTEVQVDNEEQSKQEEKAKEEEKEEKLNCTNNLHTHKEKDEDEKETKEEQDGQEEQHPDDNDKLLGKLEEDGEKKGEPPSSGLGGHNNDGTKIATSSSSEPKAEPPDLDLQGEALQDKTTVVVDVDSEEKGDEEVCELEIAVAAVAAAAAAAASPTVVEVEDEVAAAAAAPGKGGAVESGGASKAGGGRRGGGAKARRRGEDLPPQIVRATDADDAAQSSGVVLRPRATLRGRLPRAPPTGANNEDAGSPQEGPRAPVRATAKKTHTRAAHPSSSSTALQGQQEAGIAAPGSMTRARNSARPARLAAPPAGDGAVTAPVEVDASDASDQPEPPTKKTRQVFFNGRWVTVDEDDRSETGQRPPPPPRRGGRRSKAGLDAAHGNQ